jgi:peptide/nickel transport system permease protein
VTIADAAPAVGLQTRRSPSAALRHGKGRVGLALVSAVVLAGLLAPLIAPYPPDEQIAGAYLLDPGPAHWLGTDEASRDILSRTLHGIRVDLVVVFVAVPLGAILGVLAGMVATLHPWADLAAQRTFDVVLAFPVLILGIALTAIIGPGVVTIGVVIVAAEVPAFGRLARTSLLTIRELPYVEASRVIGAGNGWLLRKHLLPNSVEPLLIQLGLSMSVAVFIEGAMSFLGLGVRPPTPSLGSLIKDGVGNMWESPWFAVGPLVVVTMLVLGFLLMSQALAGARRG